MKIDYSVNRNWKYAGHLHTPFVFGVRHFITAFHPGFGHGRAERWKHIAVGAGSFLPLINYLVAGIDYAVNAKPKIIHLDDNDPYMRGLAFGTQLRKETQAMYKSISKIMVKDAEFKKWRKIFEDNIPEHVRQEMEGLAAGANVSYKEVLNIHTFVDIKAGKFGCSLLAVDQNNSKITMANHSSLDFVPSKESVARQKALSKAKTTSLKGYKKGLHAARQNVTVQSIIFDPQNGSVHLATGWKSATKNNWRSFKNIIPPSKTSGVKLARNLDWPWAICGSETVIVCMNPADGKHRFVSVTWPGYLGVLSGMNEKGVALAAAQSGDTRNVGTPNPILYRTILEENSSIAEVEEFLEDKAIASSMNLAVVANDGVIGFEFDPAKQETGPNMTIKAS